MEFPASRRWTGFKMATIFLLKAQIKIQLANTIYASKYTQYSPGVAENLLIDTSFLVPRRFEWSESRPQKNPDSEPFWNPKGIRSFSPESARFREGQPWVPGRISYNPERVDNHDLMYVDATLTGLDSYDGPSQGSSCLATLG
jgi:hypothetical protein